MFSQSKPQTVVSSGCNLRIGIPLERRLVAMPLMVKYFFPVNTSTSDTILYKIYEICEPKFN